VIETPDHDKQIADQSIPQVTRVLRAYRDRVQDLMRDTRFLFVVVFRNQGENAGATLAHPHSQIIAMPIMPRTIEIELRSARDHYRARERCLFCDIVHQELSTASRVVIENKDFVVFAPYASRSPFELFVIPRRHQHNYSVITDQELESLAATLSETVRRLRSALNGPPFNYVLHMAPNMSSKSIWFEEFPTIVEGFHWHIEIIPRLSKAAGFEWGTGFYINPTPPEEAAAYLRQVRLA
jgi:UDPglucose--hexose-1-phosphate uridylyltransferase